MNPFLKKQTKRARPVKLPPVRPAVLIDPVFRDGGVSSINVHGMIIRGGRAAAEDAVRRLYLVLKHVLWASVVELHLDEPKLVVKAADGRMDIARQRHVTATIRVEAARLNIDIG